MEDAKMHESGEGIENVWPETLIVADEARRTPFNKLGEVITVPVAVVGIGTSLGSDVDFRKEVAKTNEESWITDEIDEGKDLAVDKSRGISIEELDDTMSKEKTYHLIKNNSNNNTTSREKRWNGSRKNTYS